MKIYFYVERKSGKVWDETIATSERDAMYKLVQMYLPEIWFGPIDSYLAQQICGAFSYPQQEKMGLVLRSIEVPEMKEEENA